MPAPQISDSLWSILEPLLPPPGPKPKGGRPPVPARVALAGILLVLRSGIPCEMLPERVAMDIRGSTVDVRLVVGSERLVPYSTTEHVLGDVRRELPSRNIITLRTYQRREEAPDRKLSPEQSGRIWKFAEALDCPGVKGSPCIVTALGQGQRLRCNRSETGHRPGFVTVQGRPPPPHGCVPSVGDRPGVVTAQGQGQAQHGRAPRVKEGARVVTAWHPGRPRNGCIPWVKGKPYFVTARNRKRPHDKCISGVQGSPCPVTGGVRDDHGMGAFQGPTTDPAL
jgi:Putative transposase of IS4/5 family (DUF4096)